MPDENGYEALIHEIAEEEGEPPEVVRAALNVHLHIKRTGIEGIGYMKTAEEKIEKVGPAMTDRQIQRELRKRFRK